MKPPTGAHWFPPTLPHFAVTEAMTVLVQVWTVHALGLAMALLCTVLPIFSQSAAIRRIGPVGPLVTIALGWWVLGEAMSAWQLAGAALVVAGVLLVGRR